MEIEKLELTRCTETKRFINSFEQNYNFQSWKLVWYYII